MAAKKGSLYSYKETRFAPGGLTALALGFLSMALLIALTLISMASEGQAGRWVGAVGFTAFVVAFLGMMEGLRSFQQHCHSYLISKIGTLYCAFMVAGWFLLFCLGMAL